MRCGRYLIHLTVLLLVPVVTGCQSEPDRDDTRSTDVQSLDIPPRAASLLVEAQDAFHAQDYRHALRLADSVDGIVSGLPHVDFLRGRVYTELRQYDTAEAAYQRVVENQTRLSGVWYNLGNTQFRQGQMRRALRSYRSASNAELRPSVLLQMGRVYTELGRVDSARMAYEQAIAADSSLAAAYYQLSRVYRGEGEPARAIELVRTALEFAPGEPDYQYLLGTLLFQTGQVESAIQQLQAVVHQSPGHRGAHHALAQAFQYKGRSEKARAHREEAERLQNIRREIDRARSMADMNPRDPARWMDLGHAHRKAGQYEQAVEAFRIGQYLSPQNMAFPNNIATLFMEQGRYEGAITRYREMIEQDSSLASVWLNLGVAYAKTDSLTAAREAFEHVLRLDPKHPQARTYLNMIEQ